jgi:hypothetical protein
MRINARFALGPAGAGIALVSIVPAATSSETVGATTDGTVGTGETVSRLEISGSWGGTLASQYLFQGVDLSDGNPVVQPELLVSVNNLSAGLWFNHDLSAERSDEFDFYLQHDWQIRNVSLGTGYAYFRYPHRGWDPSQEFYFDVGVDAPLSPSLSVHYDFDAGNGSYSTLSIGRGIENPVVPLSVGANLFYQRNYYEATGFPALELTTGTEHSFGAVTVSPAVSYIATWENGDFTEDAAVPSKWLFALNVTQEF